MRQLSVSLALATGVAVALAAPLAAQGGADRVAAAVLEATGGKYADPFCSARKSSGGETGKGVKALKVAYDDKKGDKRGPALAEAITALAAATAKDAGAWFFLGRAYLLKGDVVGADSAFAQATQRQPDCEVEVDQFRQAAWVPLVNQAVTFFNADQNDSALVYYKAANAIYRARPQGFIGSGLVYAKRQQNDSAVVYLLRAVEVSNTKELEDERNSAQFNAGLLLVQANRHAEAIPVLTRYLEWKPTDMQGKRTLAVAYRGAGKAAEASALEKELLAASDAPGGGESAISTDDLFAIGATLFNEKKYAEAAGAFGKITAKEPFNRDALFNQTNAYLGAEDGENLLATALKLREIDPLNETVMKLVGEGYRRTGKQDMLMKTAEQLVGMPFSLTVESFRIGGDKATLKAAAAGREATDVNGKKLPPKALTLTFEFVDKAGAVLGTKDVAVPALQPGQGHAVEVEIPAKGIGAWRYKAKS